MATIPSGIAPGVHDIQIIQPNMQSGRLAGAFTMWGKTYLPATITDILLQHVTPSGVLTWTPTITAPGGVWMQQVVVTAKKSYCKPLINIVTVTTAEGASGVYTETSAVIEYCIYLPVILKAPSLDFKSAN